MKHQQLTQKKQIIQDWLNEKCISYSTLETKVELLEKVKKIKKKERVYFFSF